MFAERYGLDSTIIDEEGTAIAFIYCIDCEKIDVTVWMQPVGCSVMFEEILPILSDHDKEHDGSLV